MVDALGLERTRLANERTLLAYVRTALGAAGVGFGVLELTNVPPLGWVLLGLGSALLLVGVGRYFAVRRRIERVDQA